MRAAVRLEISNRDIQELRDKIADFNNADIIEERAIMEDIISFYRAQLHKSFKLGLNSQKCIEEVE